MRGALFGVLFALSSVAATAVAQPEMRGPHAITEWTPGASSSPGR